MPVEYNFGKLSRCCAGCGRRFQDKEKIFSSIARSETQLERRDFCISCWENSKKEKECVFWSRRFDKDKKRTALNKSAAFELFLRLAESDTAQSTDFCYILALLLMRKKVLHLESTETEGSQKFLVLRPSGADTTYRVIEPLLSEDRLEFIKQNLSDVFETTV
jgi:hypothetical protein